MNALPLAITFTVFNAAVQFGIGWYGWRNPRKKFNAVRKVLSALMFLWAAFSAWRIVVPDMATQQQFIDAQGMGMWVFGNLAAIVVEGVILFVVRKKYFQRVGEAGV